MSLASTVQRRPTRHRLTRLGWQVMLIGMFGMLGGALNGLNLLIVVAAVTVGVLVMQWRFSRAMIDFADIQRRLPSEIFAGSPARIRYQIQNQHRLRPLWLLRIEDRCEIPASENASDRAPTFHQRLATGVGLLAPRQSTTSVVELTVPRRGQVEIGRWKISSIAPLALSRASREQTSEPQRVDVYPHLLPLARSWRTRLPSRIGSVVANSLRQGVADDVFFGLREYRRGDSPKHIHWRTTARLGQPAVRQFEQQRRYDIALMIDAYQNPDSRDDIAPDEDAERSDHREPAEVPPWERDPVERAISLAATLAVELSGGLGALAVVAIAGERADAVATGGSNEGLRRTLQMLARATPTAQPDFDRTMRQCLEMVHHRPDLVVISPRSQSAAIASADNSLLRQWQRRCSITWIDVTSPEAAAWIAPTSSKPPRKPSNGQPADKPLPERPWNRTQSDRQHVSA